DAAAAGRDSARPGTARIRIESVEKTRAGGECLAETDRETRPQQRNVWTSRQSLQRSMGRGSQRGAGLSCPRVAGQRDRRVSKGIRNGLARCVPRRKRSDADGTQGSATPGKNGDLAACPICRRAKDCERKIRLLGLRNASRARRYRNGRST